MLRVLLVILSFILGIALVAAGVGWLFLHRSDIPYETLEAKYADASSRYIDLPGGVRMHYREQGPAEAPPLVLVHGFSASLHTWDAWADRLDDEFRVVRLDLPGHGLTRAPEGYEASIEAYRGALKDFAEARGLDRFALAGSSMGGNVAWSYALAHPEDISALILVDASGWPETRAGLAEDPPIFKLLRNPELGPLLRDLDNTALARQGLQNSFGDPSFVTDEMVDRYVELARAPGHREQLLAITLGFRSRDYATPEKLAAITAPTLILHGDQDRLIPLQSGRDFEAAIPGSKLIIYEGVGHIPQEEVAERSAEDVRAFLEAALSPGAEAAAVTRR